MLSDDLKKIDKTFKEMIDVSKKELLLLLFDRPNTFFIVAIMDILNHFNLSLVSVGIIHQNLEEMGLVRS